MLFFLLFIKSPHPQKKKKSKKKSETSCVHADNELLFQMEAVQTALTKELAIIQGPPGTGKTYVGLKVAKVLLTNRRVWTDPEVGSRPILVVCYTNHALDQFLEGILDFCPGGIVRVGSRSKSPRLEEFNLKNLRRMGWKEKTVGESVSTNIRQCYGELSSLRNSIDGATARLEASTRGIVNNVDVLKRFMLQEQFESLTKGNPSAASRQTTTDLTEWLTNGLIAPRGEEEGNGEEEDPYDVLEKAVTSRILHAKGTCPENMVDPKRIHSLEPATRAQLYRYARRVFKINR